MTRNNSQHLISLGRCKNISTELGKPPYSAVYMKEKLKEYFGETKVIIIVNNRNVVTFRSTIGTIISEFYKQPKVDDCEVEQNSIVAGLKPGFVTIFEILPDHNRAVICTARMSPSYFCSCCLPQPQGLPPGTAMERCCSPATRLGLEN